MVEVVLVVYAQQLVVVVVVVVVVVAVESGGQRSAALRGAVGSVVVVAGRELVVSAPFVEGTVEAVVPVWHRVASELRANRASGWSLPPREWFDRYLPLFGCCYCC